MKLGIPNVPGLRRDLLAVAVIAILTHLAMGAMMPILPIYLDSIGIDVKSIGLLFSVAAVAVAIGEFSWGWSMDRIHLRLPLAVGTLGLAPVLFAFAFTQFLPVLFVLFFLRGITVSAVFPFNRAFVGSTMGAHQKALFMGIFATLVGAGGTIGSFSGGYVAEHLGYVALFVIAALITFVAGSIGLPIFRAKRLTQYAERAMASPAETLSQQRSDLRDTASFKAQAAIAVLAFVSIGSVGTFVPLLAKKVILLQPSDVGLLFSITGLVNMALAVPMGRFADRYGRRALMATGLVVAGVSIAGIAYSDSFNTLLLFTVLRVVGMSAFGPAAIALLSDTAPANKQGTAMGLYGLCEDIGIIAGPAIGGFIWESFGPQPTFWFGGVPMVVAAVVAFATVRRRALVPARS